MHESRGGSCFLPKLSQDLIGSDLHNDFPEAALKVFFEPVLVLHLLGSPALSYFNPSSNSSDSQIPPKAPCPPDCTAVPTCAFAPSTKITDKIGLYPNITVPFSGPCIRGEVRNLFIDHRVI